MNRIIIISLLLIFVFSDDVTGQELEVDVPITTAAAAPPGDDPDPDPDPPSRPNPTSVNFVEECGLTKIVLSGDTPEFGNEDWILQTSSTGKDLSGSKGELNGSSVIFYIRATGDYYIRTYHNWDQLWSTSAYTVSVNTVKSYPSTPVTSVSTSKVCGETTLTRTSSPSSGVTWYWQTSATGTNSTASNAVATKKVTSGSTVYLRALNNDGCWSEGVKTVSYTINANPSQPVADPALVNSCGWSSLEFLEHQIPNSSATIQWHWQSTAESKSTNNIRSNPQKIFNSNEAGNAYVRSKNESTGCWSSVKTISYSPKAQPSIASGTTEVLVCELGNTTTISASPGANGNTIKWYDSDNNYLSGKDGTSLPITVTESTKYYARSYSTSTGCASATDLEINVSYDSFTIQPYIIDGSDSPFCSRSGGATVELKDSQSGVTYKLLRDGSDTGTFKTGTGSALSFAVSNEGSYTIEAVYTNASIGCTKEEMMYGYFEVIASLTAPDPIDYVDFGYLSNTKCGVITLSPNGTPPTQGNLGISSRWYWMGEDPDNFDGAHQFFGESVQHDNAGTYTYYLRTKGIDSGDNCWSSAVAVEVDFIPGPDPIEPISDNVQVLGNVCGEKELFMNQSYEDSDQKWYWQDSQDGTSEDAEGSLIIQEQGQYYVRAKTDKGCWSFTSVRKNVYDISLFPEEQGISLENTLDTDEGRRIKLSSSESDAVYTVFKDGVETEIDFRGTGEELLSPLLVETGDYTLEADIDGCKTPFSQSVNVSVLETNNYGVSKTIREEITDKNLINTYGDVVQSTQYMDASMRPYQRILHQGSPEHQDLVQFQVYDEFGREVNGYLPFVRGNDGQLKSNPLVLQASYYRSNSDGVTTDSKPYSEIEYDNSPYNLVKSVTGVGEDWDGVSSQRQYLRNESGDLVRIWEVDGSGLNFIGFYADSELSKNISIDEEGKQVTIFVNKLGQKILKREKLDATQDTDTYYVYDDYGRLIFVLPPMALESMININDYEKGTPHQTDVIYHEVAADNASKVYFTETGSVTVTAGTELLPGAEILLSTAVVDSEGNIQIPIAEDILSKWAFYYIYDDYGRLVEKRKPGLEVAYFVYDDLDRLVLTQDANLREDNKWVFTKYDYLNRPILTGFYVDDTYTSRLNMQSYINEALADGNFVWNETMNHGSIHGYSNVAFPNVSDADQYLSVTYYDSYDFTTSSAYWSLGDYASENKVRSLVTGSKTRVLDQGWNESLILYDSYYKADHALMKDYLGNTYELDNTYKNNVHPLLTSVTNTFTDTNGQQIEIYQRYVYDHMDRLLSIYHSMDGQPEQLIEDYTYNEMGQLVTKNLHEEANGDFAQQVDFAYNIKGWLKKINDPEDQSSGDYFSMEFLYQDATHAQYNGNIGAVKWSNPFEEEVRTYDYQYDGLNRLTAAEYATTDASSTQDYDVFINDYDLNGNIKSLIRKGDKYDGVDVNLPGQTIDDLSYLYKGNQLVSVSDASDSDVGFKDGQNLSEEYVYDANGNMLKDENKGISSVAYNYMNLPTTVVINDTTRTEYIYDASGKKWATILYQDDVEVKRTLYLGGMIYESENGEDPELLMLQNGGGRIMYHKDKSGDEKYEYQYYLTDHLGNVRTTFTTQPKIEIAVGSMEEASNAQFLEYDQLMRIKADLFNHTSGGEYSVRLNGSESEKIGPSRQLKVKPGDVIYTEVYAKYLDASQSGSWTAGLNTLAAQMAAATSGVVYEGGSYGVQDFPFVDMFSGKNDASTEPKAYLNYLVFDEHFQFVPSQSGYKQISDIGAENGTDVNHEHLSHSIEIDRSGYVYIYLSNETETTNPVEVYFDDFKVEQQHTPIVQMDNYYPFGLSFGSYDHYGIPDQTYKYNGGSEYEKTMDWYSTPFRKYDAALGRFHGADALAEINYSYGLSVFADNNPIMFNDPTGLDADDENDDPSGGAYAGWGWDAIVDMAKRLWDSTPENGSMTYNDPFGYGSNSSEGGPVIGIRADTKSRGYWTKVQVGGETTYNWTEVPLESVNQLDGVPPWYPEGYEPSTFAEYWENEKERWSKLLDGDVLGFLDVGDEPVLGLPSSSAATVTVRGVTMVLNGSSKVSSLAPQVWTVYRAVAQNGKVYWGMTKNFKQRAAQHGSRFISITEEYINIGTKGAARGLEQMKFDAAGGIKNLENTINSIGRNNPNLQKYYQEAIRYLNGL